MQYDFLHGNIVDTKYLMDLPIETIVLNDISVNEVGRLNVLKKKKIIGWC